MPGVQAAVFPRGSEHLRNWELRAFRKMRMFASFMRFLIGATCSFDESHRNGSQVMLRTEPLHGNRTKAGGLPMKIPAELSSDQKIRLEAAVALEKLDGH